MTFIVGNWKMNGLQAEGKALVSSLLSASNRFPAGRKVIICPPFTLLASVQEQVAGSALLLGAQDCSAFDKGAYTGDISPAMLKDSGASCVILGHSERRAHHGETSAAVRQKAMAAQRHGLMPIICVGETLEERKAGQAEAVVGRQLEESLPETGDLVIAYEPVWAIGTGLAASYDDIAAMHGFIKGIARYPLLYGGSVKPDNAAPILALDDVDGVLVGGASLIPEDFLAIIRAGS